MVFKGQTLVPYQGSEPYIFLSYSHKDTDEASQIVGQMMHNRFRIWYDEGVVPGTQWDEHIAARVVNCSFFIALVSRAYVRSSNCLDELNYARDKEKPILLIYLEDTALPVGMEMRLGRLLAVHKYSYDSLTAFYKKVCSAKGISACRELSIEELIERKTAPADHSPQGKREAVRKRSAVSAPKQIVPGEISRKEENKNPLPVILLILFLLLAAASVFVLLQSSSRPGIPAELPSPSQVPAETLSPAETAAVVEVSPSAVSTPAQETDSSAEESSSAEVPEATESPAAEQTISPSETAAADTVIVETTTDVSETTESVVSDGSAESGSEAVENRNAGSSDAESDSTVTGGDSVSTGADSSQAAVEATATGTEQSQSSGEASGTEIEVSTTQ